MTATSRRRFVDQGTPLDVSKLSLSRLFAVPQSGNVTSTLSIGLGATLPLPRKSQRGSLSEAMIQIASFFSRVMPQC